jgi:hypothetical protein
MRFRPSIYSQVQLTAYAPNGGYPGFYGDGEAPPAEEPKEKGAFGRALEWVWQEFGGDIKDTAGGLVTDVVTKPGKPASSGGSSAGGTTLSIPTNLTASEKALIEACKKKPLTQRAVCVAKAVQTINAQRAQAASGGGGGGGGGKGGKGKGSSTLLWVIGGVVVVGGVAAVLYTRKRK